jgi:hypothetical protein
MNLHIILILLTNVSLLPVQITKQNLNLMLLEKGYLSGRLHELIVLLQDQLH